MTISNKIEYTSIDQLYLDPVNPRLGRNNASRSLDQDKVLFLMREWTLEELAISFSESGFWVQEALLVVEEPLYGQNRLVVIEGNRRLAALKYLQNALNGNPLNRRWADISSMHTIPDELFNNIPYISVSSRQEVEAFLGFRHVTGIKEWQPAEKAQYIAMLIDERKMSYEEVMRKIGSKTDPVRRNYISYRILMQMEELEDEISIEHVEEKFSVLFLSLREVGVQRFLQIDIKADPEDARFPVPQEKLDDLASFARWLFGTSKIPPLFTDSRHVNKFAKVLESPKGVQYLKESSQPNFELAIQKSGADEPELIERIERATDEVEQALSRIHLHLESQKLTEVVERFGRGAIELLKKYPQLYQQIIEG